MEKIISGYEQEIMMLKENGNQFDKIAREKMEAQIKTLQDENSRLIRSQTEATGVSRAMDTGLKFNLELAKERMLKLKGLLLR